jgi:hypothetical protein
VIFDVFLTDVIRSRVSRSVAIVCSDV